jgi:hypothetical protein
MNAIKFRILLPSGASMMISLSFLPAIFAVISAVASRSVQTTNPSRGCEEALPDGIHKDTSVNLKLRSASGVTPRKYRLHVPSSYQKGQPVPLILSFHGRGKKAEFQEALSQFSNASYGFEGIVVYPEGVPVCSVLSQSSIIVLTTPRMPKEPNNTKAILTHPHLSTMSSSRWSYSTILKQHTASTRPAYTQRENPTAAASPASWLATLTLPSGS